MGGWLGCGVGAVGVVGCGCGWLGGGLVRMGGWGPGVDGVWTHTVKAAAVECLGKTPFGKAKSLIVLGLLVSMPGAV